MNSFEFKCNPRVTSQVKQVTFVRFLGNHSERIQNLSEALSLIDSVRKSFRKTIWMYSSSIRSAPSNWFDMIVIFKVNLNEFVRVRISSKALAKIHSERIRAISSHSEICFRTIPSHPEPIWKTICILFHDTNQFVPNRIFNPN